MNAFDPDQSEYVNRLHEQIQEAKKREELMQKTLYGSHAVQDEEKTLTLARLTILRGKFLDLANDIDHDDYAGEYASLARDIHSILDKDAEVRNRNVQEVLDEAIAVQQQKRPPKPAKIEPDYF